MFFEGMRILGTEIWPALVALVIASLTGQSGKFKVPPFTKGGGKLFLQVWLVAWVVAMVATQILYAVGASDSQVSVFGTLLIPTIVATLVAKQRLIALRISK